MGRLSCVPRSRPSRRGRPYAVLLSLLFVLLLAGEPVGAQETADTSTQAWTPALSMRYAGVGPTALSPDGSRVAYVVRSARMEGEDSEYRSQIWVVSAEGGTPVQYTRGEHSAADPSFSPDGRYLAFTSDRSGKNQVWIMRVDGGEAFRVTDAKSGVGSYRWSPDGSSIAYTMTDPPTEEEEQAKKEKRDVILVDRNFKFSHLYIVAVRPGGEEIPEARRLTEGSFHVTSFDWSPDGSMIAFAHQPDPRINTSFMASDISVVSVQGGEPRPLVAGNGVEGSPRFSPDGRWIAFTSTGDKPEPVSLGDVYVVPAAGGTPRKLPETPDRSASILGWSADGSAVYVMEAVRTRRWVLAVPLEGGGVGPVTRGEGVFGAVSLGRPATHMAFTFQTTDVPAEVYISPLPAFAMRKVASPNAGVPKPPMGRTELLSWPSRDGRFEIEGLLTYPVGYQGGQRVPLILDVHGGPAGVFSQSFTGNPGIYMLQYFAQRGYAILRANPRGSTGYGKEFRYANVRDWGYGDLDDLLAGVDQVIEMGVAHPDSLLLMGWSYGGYMTSFAVTRTDRFKAASMGAGLPDLISMVTTTDIQDYLAAHMGAEYWEDYDVYQKHSAVYHIANVKTPTQILHGAEDLRVPFTQGQEFYRSLLRLGVPTEMIVYPRTPHGPREPKLLMDVSERILTWFEKQLGRGEAEDGVGGGGHG